MLSAVLADSAREYGKVSSASDPGEPGKGGTNPGDAGNGAADPERTGSGMMRGRQKEPSFFRAGMVGYRWGLE